MRDEREKDGGGEDRRRCGLRPTYRFGGLTFRGGEGVDSVDAYMRARETHAHTCAQKCARADHDVDTRTSLEASLNRAASRAMYPPFVYVLRLTYNSACLRKRSPASARIFNMSRGMGG